LLGKTLFYWMLKILFIASLFYFLLFVWVVVQRIAYPFELEWMEGAMLDHVIRVMQSRPLYIEPSLEFIPFLYTPLFYFISAFLCSLTGIDLWPLRLISVLSTLICLVLMYLFVKKVTNSWFYGIVSIGVFTASYSISGYWFDLARVDMLALALLLGSLYCLYTSTSAVGFAISGFLMACAFFTKQTNLIPGLMMCIYCFVSLRGLQKVFFPFVFLSFTLGSSIILHLQSEGWSTYYIFILAQHHDLIVSRFLKFWWEDLFAWFTLPFILTSFWLYQNICRSKSQTPFLFLFVQAY